MSYAYAEPSLDFEDANAFLAALADTVPSVEKYTDWNTEYLDPLDQLYTPILEPKFEASSPEIVSSNGSIDEYFPQVPEESNPMNFVNPTNSSDFSQNQDTFGIAADPWLQNDATYANLLGSTMSPNFGFSPASAHTANTASSVLPGGHDYAIKQEPIFENVNHAPELDFNGFNSFGEFGLGAEDLKVNLLFAAAQPAKPALQIPEASSKPVDKPKVKAAKVTKPEKKQGRKPKTSHNVIEKKYRTSINSKIMELREVVPTLKFASGAPSMLMADLDGLTPASKLNKASILTKANEYILHMEKKNKDLEESIRRLQGLIGEAEAGSVALLRSSQSSQASSVLDTVDDYSSFMQDFNTSGLHQRHVAANSQDAGLGSNYAAFTNTNTNINGRDVPQQAPTVPGRPNLNVNLFLGGLAMLMGSSYVNDGNYQTLSALPFFPSSILPGSAAASQLLSTFSSCLGIFGVACMVYSVVGTFNFRSSKDVKGARFQEMPSVLFTSVGLKPRSALEGEDISHIVLLLTGKKAASLGTWLKCYLRLRTKEATFEALLLRFLVGTLIMRSNFVYSSLVSLDLRLHKRALMSAPYSGTNADLLRIHRLLKNVDGLLMFQSDVFADRLLNLSCHRPICDGISNGENSTLFVDALLRNKGNFYGLIFEWRVLEIIHELTLVYLDLLAGAVADDELEELRLDAQKLRQLIADSKYLTRQFSYFEMLLSPETSPELLKQDRSYILHTLQAITLHNQEPELTDDEWFSDDDSSESADEALTISRSNNQPSDLLDLIRSNKSLMCTFNLMSEEKFIALATSLVSYSVRREPTEKLLDLLNHLSFGKTKTSISLLSFACLLNLVTSIIKLENDDGDDLSDDDAGNSKAVMANMSSRNQLVLESLIKIMKGWLNDERSSVVLTTKLRNDLSGLVISKGIALNKL